MYNGIIFHDMQQLAFLSIAAAEQLICEKGMTDGIYKKWTTYHPSYELGKKIFEQFCIAGTVYVEPSLFKCLDGELIEKGVIQPYKLDKQIRTTKLLYDVDMVQMMLSEKGFDITEYSVQKITEEFNLLQKQCRVLLSIIDKYPDIEVKEIKRILQLRKFDNKEIEILDKYNDLCRKINTNPVYKTCLEYSRVADIAYQNDLLSTVSTGNGITCKGDFYEAGQYIRESSDAIMVSRYTSDKLRRIYTAGTLKDCVKLTQTDEAKAYREKIDEFINSLARSDFENMEIVDKEIEKALSAMRSQNSNITLGKIVASAGAATALAATQTDNPLKGAVATMLGTIITFAGVPIAFYDPTKKYMWASFGIYS